MITICSIKDAKPEEHDETWAIVRSYKNVSPKVRQVAELSPSWDLFSKSGDLFRKTGGAWRLLKEHTFRNL